MAAQCSDYRSYTDPPYPQGIVNNNPGDIRAGENWQGLTGTSAKGFCQFSNVCWGLRALAKDLTNKIKEGVDTISLIINKYAPPSDSNPTAAYISNVAALTGIDANTQLGTDADTITSLMTAIVSQEIGEQYAPGGSQQLISNEDIEEGYAMTAPSVTQALQSAAIQVSNNANNSGTVLIVLIGIGLLTALFSKRN
jgi:hypothetical protein